MARGGGADRRFVRTSLGVLGAQILVTVLGVGTGVITARALGPHDRGLFQLLILLPTTLANLVKLGIPQANVYCIRRRGEDPSVVASNALVLALALGGALAVACYLAREWLFASVLRDVPPVALPPVLVALPFVLAQAFLLGVLQAQERFREYNVQHVVPTVLGLVGMAVALLWFEAGLMGAILTQTAIVMFVTVWLVLRVHRRAPLRPAWDARVARGMLGFGGKSYVQTLAATLHLRIDQYMIAMFLDPAQVGLYAIAVNLGNLLLKVPDAAGTVLFPRLAEAAEADAHAATSRVCRHTLFVTAAMALGLALFGGLAVRVLYGARYLGAVPPLLLLLPGVVMISLYLLLTRNFTSRNRQGVNVAAAATALTINVALNCVLIPRWGIAGAALASTASYSAAALILLFAFVRESGYTVTETVLVRPAEIGGYVRLAARVRGLVGAAGD